ncbi:CIA30 family protein [Balneola sp. MJW-20]|uniref:CIA30 family protein n=1 Tax=Gracilimonas aurantiaca TaxID=3234185 RepID=UPI003465E4AF
MKYLIISLLFTLSMNTQVLFDFNNDDAANQWQIEDDVVMGGRSSGNFSLSDQGYGIFEGEVSLENNGGFSSLQNRHDPISVNKDSKIRLRVKGDGKRYQFRVKRSRRDYQSYITYFDTNGEWQEIEIALSDMYPNYRGNRLDGPNFNHDYFEVTRFFIGNKKPQSFRLLIDEITLVSE